MAGTAVRVFIVAAFAGCAVCKPNMSNSYDTIVVGLGAAGVTAASTLAKAGKRVLGLEADNRIGGRVKTVDFGDGVVELGAEWIHGTVKSRVYDSAVQNNVSTLEQDLTTEVFRSDGNFGDRDLFNELSLFCREVVEQNTEDPEPLGQYVTKRLMDYLKEKHPEVLKDQDFVNEFLELMNLFSNNYEASNDWNDVTTQTTYDVLEGHLHTSWHRHGYKTFFEILLNTYNNGTGLPTLDIKLSKEVTQIKWPKDSTGDVEVECKDGEKYTAKNVIVTVSMGVLKERYPTLFSPMLPPDKVIAIDKIAFGVVGKIILSFPEKWWPASHFYALFWSGKGVKELDKDDKWLAKVALVTLPMGSSNTLTFWTSGDVAKMVSIKHGGIRRTHCTDALRYSHLFLPSLPQDKVEMIQTISMGVMDKVILSFDNAWWKNISYNFMMFLWRGVDKKNISDEDYWTTRIFGCSTPMGSQNALTLWTSGDVGKLVETLPEDVVRTKTVELLRRFMGANFTIPEPTGMVRSTWYSNPFTRGSYTYDNLVMSQYPNARAVLAAPLLDSAGTPKVLFAGEATDPTHFSTVHGASDSGYREAMRLLPASKI